MKRLLWLALLAILPISNAFGEKQPLNPMQGGPFGIFAFPKWYPDASVAIQLYETGTGCLASNPQLAVKDLQLALLYARRAEAEGGGEVVERISVDASRALSVAEANLNQKDGTGNDNANGKICPYKNNGDDQGQTMTRASTPKNNGITIKTGGGLARLGGSQTGGTPKTRAGF